MPCNLTSPDGEDGFHGVNGPFARPIAARAGGRAQPFLRDGQIIVVVDADPRDGKRQVAWADRAAGDLQAGLLVAETRAARGPCPAQTNG
jgi:hypothetical protein